MLCYFETFGTTQIVVPFCLNSKPVPVAPNTLVIYDIYAFGCDLLFYCLRGREHIYIYILLGIGSGTCRITCTSVGWLDNLEFCIL